MADANTVVEGKIKLREGRKWRRRWSVLKKASPVADSLQILLYKDLVEFVTPETKPKSVITLNVFFGLDAGFTYDGELHVMAIICERKITLMAFEVQEDMIEFEIKIRESLGEEYQFPVTVVRTQSKKCFSKEAVRIIIHERKFCIIAQQPPKIIQSWSIEDLRRYGTIGGKFCFEVRTDCEKESSVYILEAEQAEEIADIFNLAASGKMVNCHRKAKSRRRISQPVSQDVVRGNNYTVQTIQIGITSTEQNAFNESTPLGAVSQVCSWYQSTGDCDNNDECTNPAKSVLRPRSGQEYVIVQRRLVPTPVNSTRLPTHSPAVKGVFNFDFHCSTEDQGHHRHHHHHNLQDPLTSFISLSRRSRSLNNTPQNSPRFSSTAETVKSYCSMLTEPGNEPSASSLNPVLSLHSSSVSHIKYSKQNHSPHSPFPDHLTQTSPSPHTPDYVNQEFVDKHYSASCSSRTISTSSSHSSTSSIRSGTHSFMTLIFKDSTKHQSTNEFQITGSGSTLRKGRALSRDSESDAKKADKHSLNIPLTKPSNSTSGSVQRSNSHPKKSEKDETLQFISDGSVGAKILHKECDKFVNSTIISRRRLKCAESNQNSNTETSSSNDLTLKETGLLHITALKSSGYKNIDSIKAAAYAAANTPSPRSLSSGPSVSNIGQTSQLENIWESHTSSRDQMSSSTRSSFFSETNSVFTSQASDMAEVSSIRSSVSLPHSSSPAPPLPRRNRISSSPLPSPCLTPFMTRLDDSPPPYFAPSPPSTPLPTLPPRQPLLSPSSSVPPSTPSETDIPSDSSDGESELNYIEIDMTKSQPETTLPPKPLSSFHQSKRIRQQKKKDSAKLRYVEIDHQATKALQQARQEHVQGRVSNMRYSLPKEENFKKVESHFSRINLVPASYKRKSSLVQRERKLSSGSIESC